MKTKKIVIIVLILTLFFFSAYQIYYIILRGLYPKKYSEFVEKYSTEYGIEEEWIYAIIKAESNFEADCVSQSKAVRANANNGRNCFRCDKRTKNRRI